MHFIPEEIEEYVMKHSQDEPELLKQLHRETYQKVLVPRMLSGHFQGRFLSMLSKLSQPKYILEIGTYTGYSALCLAEGMHTSGELHTIDHNEELFDFQRKYFDKSEFGQRIVQHLGSALDIIPTIDRTFDLIFIDADKENYCNYFHAIIDNLNPGGIIITDNVLWSGKVIEKLLPNDEETKTIIQYNDLLKNDPRIETIMLPIRDGLTICRKV